MNNLEEAIAHFTRKNGNFNRKKFCEDNSEYKKTINKNIEYDSLNELVYRIKHKMYKGAPLCPVCGKKMKFLHVKGDFQKHCSPSCANKDPKTNEKRQKTILERYGKYPYNNREKYEETMIKKYGVKSSLCNGPLRAKGLQTKLNKYGSETYNNKEKTLQTCLERYGTGRNNRKAQETMLKKYGVKSFLASKYCNEIRNNKEIQQKIQNTKRINQTFNTSNIEEEYFKELCEKYGEKNVLRQYKDKRYPFNCDFYIASEDLFIELNIFWTHGKHPFDKTNIKDLIKLGRMKIKAKKSKFMKNAIETWTVRDVNKFNIAKKNKLNYMAVYEDGGVYYA